jgi:hypothetical protein
MCGGEFGEGFARRKKMERIARRLRKKMEKIARS